MNTTKLISRVTLFQTPDGGEFKTEAEARAHLHRISTENCVREYYNGAFSANRLDSFIKSFLHDPIPLRDALTKLIRQNNIKDESKVEPE